MLFITYLQAIDEISLLLLLVSVSMSINWIKKTCLNNNKLLEDSTLCLVLTREDFCSPSSSIMFAAIWSVWADTFCARWTLADVLLSVSVFFSSWTLSPSDYVIHDGGTPFIALVVGIIMWISVSWAISHDNQQLEMNIHYYTLNHDIIIRLSVAPPQIICSCHGSPTITQDNIPLLGNGHHTSESYISFCPPEYRQVANKY